MCEDCPEIPCNKQVNYIVNSNVIPRPYHALLKLIDSVVAGSSSYVRPCQTLDL